MSVYTYEHLHPLTENERAREIILAARKIYEEEYKDKPIPALRYSLYRLFRENGDRAQFEKMYFDRRRRLFILQLLALADDIK